MRIGGGELGRGFYIGDLPHEAFNWSRQIYKEDYAVVELKIEDDDILIQQPHCLNYEETCWERNKIRNLNQTRTYLFNENIVWAPVVGKNIPNFNQLKFESNNAENLVNSNVVDRKIL